METIFREEVEDMEDESTGGNVCKRCGSQLPETEGTDVSFPYCSQCRIELAEKRIPDRAVRPTPSSRRRTIFALGKWVLLIGCSALVVVNSAILARLFIQERPRDFAPPEIDKEAVLCLSNLSDIAATLSSGELPPDSIVCPASGTPYVVEFVDGDIFISCPNAEEHDVRTMRVSTKTMDQEVLK